MNSQLTTILVTGGAGYVGSVLVPKLLARGYRVKVLDLYIYGRDVLAPHPQLEEIWGDIRDRALLTQILPGCDAVIHLAAISNDPSFDLNPALSRAINYDAFTPLVEISQSSGVQRFIFASSASVYGISDAPEVTEEHPLVPLTDYNKYKGLCEKILLPYQSPNFTTVIVRPATLCGYAPRQRLDLTVNILTNHACNAGKITVFGGSQYRPNLHIQDMTDLYLQLLEEPKERIAGEVFNAGNQNHSVRDIAEIVREVVQQEFPEKPTLEIVTTPSDDIRSYRLTSDKIRHQLGFMPKYSIADAVRELCQAFAAGKLPNSLTDARYFNIKLMQEINLK
jgi:nucleoside-diphosphate-sugar epimerase